jgi:hypothetical protein
VAFCDTRSGAQPPQANRVLFFLAGARGFLLHSLSPGLVSPAKVRLCPVNSTQGSSPPNRFACTKTWRNCWSSWLRCSVRQFQNLRVGSCAPFWRTEWKKQRSCSCRSEGNRSSIARSRGGRQGAPYQHRAGLRRPAGRDSCNSAWSAFRLGPIPPDSTHLCTERPDNRWVQLFSGLPWVTGAAAACRPWIRAVPTDDLEVATQGRLVWRT